MIASVAAFVLVQFTAAMAATPFLRWLFGGRAPR
jgi:hypothetical protein